MRYECPDGDSVPLLAHAAHGDLLHRHTKFCKGLTGV